MIDPNDPELEREEANGEIEDGETLLADEEAGDAGAEDGEGQEEAEGQEVEAGPARKPNRAQSRIKALQDQLKEQRERDAQRDREIQELRAEQRQRAQQAQQESPESKAARRALMAPEEVMREDLRESETRTQNLLHQHMMQQREENDARGYNEMLRDNPRLKRFDAEVERVRKEQLANGQFVPRSVLLKLAIGEAALKAAETGGNKKQAQAAERRVAQATVKPGNNRGDVGAGRGRQGDSLEKRLENVLI